MLLNSGYVVKDKLLLIMTQEDKELLLKDLSARLSYGVKVSKVVEDWTSDPHPIRSINLNNIIVEDGEFEDGTPDIDVWNYEDIKPYLFPLSSMTKEQKEFIKNKFCYDWDIDDHPYSLWAHCIDIGDIDELIDWFHKNHFDYRSLIEKELAIDATEKNIY